MSSTAKLTAEQIENLAKEIREFLLEHGLATCLRIESLLA